MSRPPSPIVVPPSGSFDGNDGAWSTFLINVGDDGSGSFGQNFKTLVSTSSSTTLLPLQADWCNVPSPRICAERRGILPYNSRQSQGYQRNASSQYQDLGLFNLDIQPVLHSQPANGRYGLDSIGIGLASPHSPVLVHQLVAGHVSQEPFLSSVGLSTNLLDLGSGGTNPYLTSLNASRAIPSLSYSYTAGARYREKGIPGSLVLGGYDKSRFKAGMSLSMPGPANSSLVVGVQSVTITAEPHAGGNMYSATSNTSGFFAVIDSTLPYLWMPKAVCDAFEALFGLTYDSTTGYYLVNDTALEFNRKRNMTVSIQIGEDVRPSVESVSIELPYDAFDLTSSSPVFRDSTRYFPIRRALDDKNIIGRTFLQESMLIVDYERRNFTIAQAKFFSRLQPVQIISITGSQMPGPNREKPDALVVALPVAFVILVALAMTAWHFYSRSVRRRSENSSNTSQPKHTQEMDSSFMVCELQSPLKTLQGELDANLHSSGLGEEPASLTAIELPANPIFNTQEKLDHEKENKMTHMAECERK